jgi:hypothetical protein
MAAASSERKRESLESQKSKKTQTAQNFNYVTFVTSRAKCGPQKTSIM